MMSGFLLLMSVTRILIVGEGASAAGTAEEVERTRARARASIAANSSSWGTPVVCASLSTVGCSTSSSLSMVKVGTCAEAGHETG